MVVCGCCMGNFDSGELTGGMCPECAEEERQREARADMVNRLLNSRAFQMEMELELEGAPCRI